VNFHVAKTMQGELRTIKAVHGRYYTFYLAAAAAAAAGSSSQLQHQLVITELDTTQQKSGRQQLELELLDVGADCSCGAWGSQLPIRLREMCSHWLCR
jgi:hypothetical protein